MKLTSGLKSTGDIVQETPQGFFDFLDGIFRFDLDVCALPENAKCDRFYTPEMDGLKQPWGGGEYGAILPMAKISSTGYAKHLRNTSSRTTGLWSCCCRPEQIRNGSRSMCIRMLGFGLSTAA